MALTCTISGTDRTTSTKANTVYVTSDLNHRDTLSLTVLSTVGGWAPAVGQSIVYTYSTGNFTGSIDKVVAKNYPGPVVTGSTVEYALTCVDNSQIADRRVVSASYANQTAGAIVTDLVTGSPGVGGTQGIAAEGVTISGGSVQTGPTLTKVVFNYLTVAQALNELATLTGMAWWIDASKVLHFVSRDTIAAPFSITDAAPNCQAISATTDRAQYRNKQITRAGTDVTGNQDESQKGDGSKRAFLVSYPIDSTPTISVNGTSKVVGIQGVTLGVSQGGTAQWFWSRGSNTITQDSSETILASTDSVRAQYVGRFPIVSIVQSDSQIAARQAVEGGSGVYEDQEDDPNLDSRQAATDRGNGQLRRFGQIPQVITIDTLTDGLAAGQLLPITWTGLGLSGSYLIASVKGKDEDGKRMRWTVTALSGESQGTWVDYFQQMMAAAQKAVIRENEVAELVRAPFDTISITDSMTATASAATTAYVDVAIVDFSEVA